MYAVVDGNESAVHVLVRYGTALDLKNKIGKSALDYAAEQGKASIAFFLQSAFETGRATVAVEEKTIALNSHPAMTALCQLQYADFEGSPQGLLARTTHIIFALLTLLAVKEINTDHQMPGGICLRKKLIENLPLFFSHKPEQSVALIAASIALPGDMAASLEKGDVVNFKGSALYQQLTRHATSNGIKPKAHSVIVKKSLVPMRRLYIEGRHG